jgi:2-polyprenyl-3-methyl-5-hydroxy-6-metoxy-1,4-benzoquinol methylase
VDVYGLDLNADVVARAKLYESAQIWDLDKPVPLPFADAFFDAVVAKDILEHLQKPWRMVAEIKRVMRPGGIILASVICERGHRTWSDYTHVRGFTEWVVCRLLRG